MSTSGSGSALPDRAALVAALDAQAQAVFRFCARRCLDRALAEDLMSVVFLEAWRGRDRAVLVDGPLRPWLYGIATNVLRNSTRSGEPGGMTDPDPPTGHEQDERPVGAPAGTPTT